MISINETAAKPASILFSAGCLFNESSGPYHSLRQTVNALRAKHHALTVVGTKSAGEGEVTGWGGGVHAFPRRGPHSLHYAPDLSSWLKRQPGVWDVASMQGVWMHTNWAVADWCVKNERPFMITSHGNFNPTALRISAWKKWLATKTFMKLVFEHVSCYQALTETEYQTLRSHGVRSPICVIGNGIERANSGELDPVDSVIPKELLKRRTCLYLGRLFHIKGIDRLLRAWASIAPGEDWQLIIAGSGEAAYEAELKQIALASGCRNVFFVGHVTGQTKAAWLQLADFTVLPSHSEAFPMAVLEAFAYGSPAVLTNACGLPEAARAGAALEVESSQAGIAGGLSEMLALPANKLQQMSLAAERLVESQYTWPIVTAQLVSVYDWLRGGGAVPQCVRLN